MYKYIVTTTISPPTEATKRFASMKDWKLIVVGDKKTPHDTYKDINCIYLSPEYQQNTYPELSDAIGWNCIQRRNIGFVDAYKRGADIVATVDDDNIPYSNWGEDVRVGCDCTVDTYLNESGIVFDPLQLTNHPELWHRGYPLSLIQESKKIVYLGKIERNIKIQADLWDGDPDVDAICRLMYKPTALKLEIKHPFISSGFSTFNSQNTFIHRDVLPNYMVLPFVGRMDDIWGGYLAQWLTGERVLFMPATVYQERNTQSIEKNLRDEVLGYTKTEDFIYFISEWHNILPPETVKAFDLYRKAYDLGNI